jgi:FixJ family two-component response regulator
VVLGSKVEILKHVPQGSILGKAMPGPEAVVAIVDDDPSMLRSIDCLLGAHGFAVETFASAERFLLRNSSIRPVCLILDINLGGLSGIELARILASRDVPIPIIFITATDDRVTCEQAKGVGYVAYLRKPFPGRQLVAAIAKASSTQATRKGSSGSHFE